MYNPTAHYFPGFLARGSWQWRGFGGLCRLACLFMLLLLTLPVWSATPMLAAGCCQSYLLRSDGSVWAWGNNSSGRLGDGSPLSQPYPVQTQGGTVWASVAAGGFHTLLLHRDGTVWAMGENRFGQLGTGDLKEYTAPVKVAGLTEVSAIAAGNGFSLALRRDGSVWAWGNNNQQQLGGGDATVSLLPAPVTGLPVPATQISAGTGHALALLRNGLVYGWGDNSAYQLDPNDGAANNSLPMVVSPNEFRQVKAIYAGSTASGIVRMDGSVWTQGSFVPEPPRPVRGLGGVSKLTGYNGGFGALTSSGRVWVWGDNSLGTLANGTTTANATPTVIPGLSGISDLAFGSRHGLALDSTGQLWAWGFAAFGQLGNGVSTSTLRPQPVPGFSGSETLAAGAYTSLALNRQGQLSLSGYNFSGQQLDGSTLDRIQPHAPAGLPAFSDVQATAALVMGLTTRGQLLAWGDDPSGNLVQLSARGAATQATAITDAPAFTRFALGLVNDFVLGITAEGEVWAWGDNSYGQLGDGTFSRNPKPRPVSGISDAIQVAAGAATSYALKRDGSVWGWGYNNLGQLADQTSLLRPKPVPIAGLANIVRIQASGWYATALDKDGNLFVWGQNDEGVLCTGDTQARDRATRIASEIRLVATGVYHLLMLDQKGQLFACGYNGQGQLGDGTETSRSKRVLIGTYPQARSLSAGPDHSLLLNGDPAQGGVSTSSTSNSNTPNNTTALAWGNNYSGALGSGTLLFANLPARVPGPKGKGFFNADPSRNDPAALAAFDVAAQVNGSRSSLTLDLSLVPAEADRGSTRNVYLVAKLGSNLLTHDGRAWRPVSGSDTAPWFRGVLPERLPVPVVRRADLSRLSGLVLYLGYGDSLDDVLKNQTWKAVYSVP